MSSFKELEELQHERTKLEDESHTLKEEQKKLEEKARLLEEKIMEELKNKNEAARQAITQLESMTNELEQKLKQVSQQPETSKLTEGTAHVSDLEQVDVVPSETSEMQQKEELTEEPEIFAETANEGTDEGIITVQPQETEDATRRPNQKKKGRFF